jgi:hypothetical protein
MNKLPGGRRSCAWMLFAGVAMACAATSSAVQAAGNFVPASACEALNGRGGEHIWHAFHGLHNLSNDSVNVICPVVRPSGSAKGVTVWVNGTVSANVTMGCVLTSTSYEGSVTASKSFIVTGAANGTKFDKQMSLSADDAPYYSYQSLICDLPQNSKGSLRGYIVFAN